MNKMNNTLLLLGVGLIIGAIITAYIGSELVIRWTEERQAYLRSLCVFYNTTDQTKDCTPVKVPLSIVPTYREASGTACTTDSVRIERTNILPPGIFKSTEEWCKANDAAWEEKLRKEKEGTQP